MAATLPRGEALAPPWPPAAQPARAADGGRRDRRRPAIPARYALVALGSGLLMVGIPLSVPLGPAAGSAGRELGACAASLAGVALLFLAGLDATGVDAWCARRRWLRQVGLGAALLLVGGTLATLAGASDMILHAPASRVYVTDIVSLTATDAELVLAGRNPYTSDAAYRWALERFPYALGTPLRGRTFGTGDDHPAPARIAAVQRRYVGDPRAAPDAFDPRTLHSYPALSFLLYVPLLWAGAGNILVLHLFVYWVLFAWLIWRAPVGWRAWGALTALAAMPTVAASLIESNEVVCIALILAAWHLRERRWASALLLGLACAFKQYAWFFAPFFLLEALLASGWREAGRRGLLTLGAFLLPNLPYLLMSPGPWFQSLWLPMSEPLFATGVGVIALSVGHLVPYAPPVAYALLELLAMGGALLAYARYRAGIGDGVLVLALIPLLFAFRSLTDYFGFVPWLALYAVDAVERRRATGPLSPLGRLTLAEVRSWVAGRVALPCTPTPAPAPTGAVRAGRPGGAGASRADEPRPEPVGGIAPSSKYSYHPTGRAHVDRALARIDAVTGGRAGWVRRLASYLLVGGLGALVNLGCFTAVYAWVPLPGGASLRWAIAFAAGTEVSVLFTFALNDTFTFRYLLGHRRSLAARCGRFHLTSAGGVAVTLLISATLHRLSMPAELAQAVALLFATLFNFSVHHLYTYRPAHLRAAQAPPRRGTQGAGPVGAHAVIRRRVSVRAHARVPDGANPPYRRRTYSVRSRRDPPLGHGGRARRRRGPRSLVTWTRRWASSHRRLASDGKDGREIGPGHHGCARQG